MTGVAEAPPTRAEWVDSLLRRAIMRGELAPGERLYAERLAEQWGVSPTPLRETFQRLAGEGLVVIEPQRGARVAPVDADRAAEIYELRLLLDPVAVEQSVIVGMTDPDFAVAVDAAHRRLTRRHRSITDWHEAHRGFHLALVSRCGNQLLLRQVAQLLEHSQRFQVAGIGRAGGRVGDPVAEHEALRSAAVRGCAAEAASVLREHLAATLAAVQAGV
ncbi:MAG: GntR family transcriptional regulator [Actinomycetota bacterium]